MTTNKKTIDICGVLVHAMKGKEQDIQNKLINIKGVEVHHITEDSRFIVTIEQESQDKIIDTMQSFNDIPGVVSTVLTYQHSEQI